MTYDYNLLMNKAKEASKTSYSPFSKFAVGAAVLAKSGAVYTGCNVENSSFGWRQFQMAWNLHMSVLSGQVQGREPFPRKKFRNLRHLGGQRKRSQQLQITTAELRQRLITSKRSKH